MAVGTWFERARHGAGLAIRALLDREHPILAQIVPMRRCNLACGYCNEYDKVSKPVELATVRGWVDKLAELRTEIVTISGGEPMLHPDLETIIASIRQRGMIAGLITNGYFLQPERIKGLNRAGLQYLQISIDNVKPDEVSKKSLEVLDSKLVNLAKHAEFQVNVNSVLGSGCPHPDDALTIAARAKALGFSTTIGIIHNGRGHLEPLSPSERAIYDKAVRLASGAYSRVRGFQENLVEGKPNDWQCRAGARYLYVCEDGLVHYCSQQRGYPGVPLASYTQADIAREFNTAKACAPFCTIGCVHRASALDKWRARQAIPAVAVQEPVRGVESELPGTSSTGPRLAVLGESVADRS